MTRASKQRARRRRATRVRDSGSSGLASSRASDTHDVLRYSHLPPDQQQQQLQQHANDTTRTPTRAATASAAAAAPSTPSGDAMCVRHEQRQQQRAAADDDKDTHGAAEHGNTASSQRAAVAHGVKRCRSMASDEAVESARALVLPRHEDDKDKDDEKHGMLHERGSSSGGGCCVRQVGAVDVYAGDGLWPASAFDSTPYTSHAPHIATTATVAAEDDDVTDDHVHDTDSRHDDDDDEDAAHDVLFFHCYETMTPLRVRLGVVPLPDQLATLPQRSDREDGAKAAVNNNNNNNNDDASRASLSRPESLQWSSWTRQGCGSVLRWLYRVLAALRLPPVDLLLQPRRFFATVSRDGASVDVVGWSALHTNVVLPLPAYVPVHHAARTGSSSSGGDGAAEGDDGIGEDYNNSSSSGSAHSHYSHCDTTRRHTATASISVVLTPLNV